MANSIIRYPLPILGLNTVNPYVEHDSGYARELTNYSIKDGRLFMRAAVGSAAFNSAVATNAISAAQPIWFDPSSVTFDMVTSNGARINYTTFAGAPVEPAATFAQHTACTQLTFSGTATTLNMVFGARRLATPNQPILATTPFTSIGPTAAFGVPYCACSHKGRLYYANNTYTVEWGNVGQVAGAFPVANTISFEQFLNGQTITRLFSVSLSPGTAPSQNVLVVFGSGGRVLVFEGDTPTSANWNMIFAGDATAPIGRLSFLEIDSDIFVVGKKYCYWFKDLFRLQAQGAYENSPTIPIENLWQDIFVSISLAGDLVYAVYEPTLDAIIILCDSFPTLFDYEAPTTASLVYFRKYKAWSVWGIAPFFAPIVTYNNSLYGIAVRCCPMIMIPSGVGRDVYYDQVGLALDTVDIETSWKTPYAFLDKGIGLELKAARAWVDVRKINYTAEIYKTRAIFDYSDLNTPYGFYTQSSVTQINPQKYTEAKINLPSSDGLNYNTQYNPLLQLGGGGGGLSLQITFNGTDNGEVPDPGYSLPDIYSIYALSALVQPGSEIF